MILVTAATRHGSTRDIADRIALVLRSHGHDAVSLPMAEVLTLDGVDNLVLGSAIYYGGWLTEAEAFVATHANAIKGIPTWAFSSGPIGDPPLPEGAPQRAEATLAGLGLREHKIFAGRVDRAALGIRERTVLKVVKAEEGDFRRWDEIEDWAAQVGTQLG